MGHGEAALIKAAGAVVYRPGAGGPEFLLLRNARHGTWAPPKGHLEEGESALEAARREIEEELGRQPALHYLPGFGDRITYRVEQGGVPRRKEVTWFLARHGGDPLVLSAEHDEMAWAALAPAGELLAHQELRELLRRARDFLQEFPGEGREE